MIAGMLTGAVDTSCGIGRDAVIVTDDIEGVTWW